MSMGKRETKLSFSNSWFVDKKDNWDFEIVSKIIMNNLTVENATEETGENHVIRYKNG